MMQIISHMRSDSLLECFRFKGVDNLFRLIQLRMCGFLFDAWEIKPHVPGHSFGKIGALGISAFYP